MSTPADKAKSGKVQGEGDYVAGRRFDEAQKGFVQSGQADKLGGEAAPEDAAQASELEQAERQGKSHSKGEAPGDMKPKTKGKQPR